MGLKDRIVKEREDAYYKRLLKKDKKMRERSQWGVSIPTNGILDILLLPFRLILSIIDAFAHIMWYIMWALIIFWIVYFVLSSIL